MQHLRPRQEPPPAAPTSLYVSINYMLKLWIDFISFFLNVIYLVKIM